MGKINSFTDLYSWKEGHQLVLSVYDLTKSFTKNDYALTNQMRRCAISITSNIAEGFSRQGKKEKIQFYHIAKGSITELHNQLIICKDIHLISDEKFNNLEDRIFTTGRLLTGLIRSAESK